MPRSFTLASLLLSALLLSGCGQKDSAKYTIYVIPKGLTHEFWQSIHRGARKAAEDLTAQGTSVRIEWDGPAREDEPQPQIRIVDHAISRNASGIVLAPQHKDTMVDAVERAARQGIPVAIIDSGLARPELYVRYVATDNYRGGRLAAEHLLSVLQKQGKKAPRLVLFRYQSGSESTAQREQGFLDHVSSVIERQKKEGQPAITWVSTDIELGATKDSALANSRPLLADQRDRIDGIFTPNESSASGVVEALRSLGLAGKVRLVGFDSSVPLLQALEAGDIDGLIVQDPYRMGYLGVWSLVQHLEGRRLKDNERKELGTGEYLVTRDNVREQRIRELFEPDLQVQRRMELPELSR